MRKRAFISNTPFAIAAVPDDAYRFALGWVLIALQPRFKWAVGGGGRGTDWARSIATTAAGSHDALFVTGGFDSAATFGKFRIYAAQRSHDMFVIKVRVSLKSTRD